MRLSFTFKVFSAIILMILVILSGVLYFFDLRAGEIAEQEINRRLEMSKEAFVNYDNRVRDKLRAVNAYISGNAAYKALYREILDLEDEAEVIANCEDQFNEMQNFSDCNFMLVLGETGEIVFDNSGGIADDVGPVLEAYMNKVDEGQTPIGQIQSRDEIYTVIMASLQEDDVTFGYVLVGYVMNNETLRNIGEITYCDILVLSENARGEANLVASYFQDGKSYFGESVVAAQSQAEVQQVFSFQAGANTYKGLKGHFMSVAGEKAGIYITANSVRNEMAPFRQISNGLMLIGGIAILLVAPLSVLAARRVTRPVNHLAEAIREVHNGHLDEHLIQVSSQDEIGELAAAFKLMVRELREQAELITFLEESAQARGMGQTQIDPEATLLLDELPTLTPSMMAGQIRDTLKIGGSLQPGFLLADRYKIKGLLGRGGMGVVYKAVDQTLDEVVAIKMLHVDTPSVVDMLKQETKLARKITHRNIIRIHDLGELEGFQYVSMEYIKGTTVKDLLKRVKRLPLKIGLRISRQVCAGLGAAHEEGVVHGDIKPENVILNAKGEIKIMDFGVARATTVESEDGKAAGTPKYMAPEQFQGGRPDKRSDIYSLGIMMFELFAGKVPFKGNTLIELFKKHLSEAPPNLARLNMELPLELVYLIEKSISKNPEDRFSSTAEMLEQIRQIA